MSVSLNSYSKSLLLLILSLLGSGLKAQLIVDAGPVINACPGLSYSMGGSPTALGGTPPYVYSWSPQVGLNSATVSNPIVTPGITATVYTVTVTDGAGNIKKDSVWINLSPLFFAHAADDIAVCYGDSAFLGFWNNPTVNITYSWTPVIGLNDATSPNPMAVIPSTLLYTVVMSSPGCASETEDVLLTVNPLPIASAGPDVTILEGQSVTLQGSGGSQYFWFPTNTLFYWSTPTPDAFPITTTNYAVLVTDANGCQDYDDVLVTVIPDATLEFYNTFTPNNDGDNDVFYISNVLKYPENSLIVFNRFGKVVYSATPYLNNWTGKTFGEELPAATYYYVFDPGNGGEKKYGGVTIIR
jgi:gliding motility-associated-like protein